MDHVYGDVTGNMCSAVDCSAALQQENKIDTITDDIPLLHFLSGKTSDSGNDQFLLKVALIELINDRSYLPQI